MVWHDAHDGHLWTELGDMLGEVDAAADSRGHGDHDGSEVRVVSKGVSELHGGVGHGLFGAGAQVGHGARHQRGGLVDAQLGLVNYALH